MPSRSDILDELLRMTQEYKRDDGRRRVPIASLIQQPAGNAVALPKPAESGPEINEFAYLGTPSPPVEGTPGMPAMTRPPIKMPGLLDPQTAPGLPPGYSYWDDGSVKDPDGNPARFEAPARSQIAKDLGTAAFTGPFGIARSALSAMQSPGMAATTLAGKGAITGLEKLAAEYDKRDRKRGER